MTLDKKLGIWGKDKIYREDNKMYAKDYYCVECYSQNNETPAESFWPVIDVDIKSYPYCKKHLEERQQELFLELCGL